jgi:hypothetical protein
MGGTPQKEARGGEVSLLFCLDRLRVHASAKGAPSDGVETLDNNDSYKDDVPSVRRQTPREQPNLMTGVASRRSRAGPLARRRKVERHHYSSALTAKGACSHQRGRDGAGLTQLTRMTRTTTRAMMLQASCI